METQIKDEKTTHRPTTTFSDEQVIIAQLQGSTESSSQLFKTPWGSFKVSFRLIKATTAIKNKEQKPKQQNQNLVTKKKAMEIYRERELSNTFMVARFIGETEWSRAEKEEKGKEVDNHGYGIMAMKNKILTQNPL